MCSIKRMLEYCLIKASAPGLSPLPPPPTPDAAGWAPAQVFVFAHLLASVPNLWKWKNGEKW